jgi:hypothetical protein
VYLFRRKLFLGEEVRKLRKPPEKRDKSDDKLEIII